MAIAAQAIVDRIRQKLGAGWKDPSVDTFLAGSSEIEVKGIVTTYAPTMEVLRKTVAAGSNMILSREAPFWARNTVPGAGRAGGGRAAVAPANAADAGRANGAQGAAPNAAGGGAGAGGRGQQSMDNDPTYRAKRDYIASNNIVVYRFFENWNARQPDAQLQGLARALGWEKLYKPSGGAPWATLNGFFAIPPGTLRATAQSIKKTLKMKCIRIVGDPETRVTKAALSHGMYSVSNLEKHLEEPGVDLVIIGEPVEWEASPYFADLITSGQKKGMIILGQEISEEPGCGEMATWLKSFISDVPVEWISAGEPEWMPY